VLGQLQTYDGESQIALDDDQEAAFGFHTPKRPLNDDDDLSKVRYWERRLLKAQAKAGPDGIYKLWRLFKQNRNSYVVTHPQANVLRERLLVLLLDDDARLLGLVDHAKELREKKDYVWPDIYVKIIHSFLEQGLYDKAVAWHWRLAPELLPTPDSCGLLLANFATHEAPEMQLALAELYDLQTEHRFYDHIIPTLYGAGKSKLARAWRRKLLKYQDFPTTDRSRPFLHFMRRYYPKTRLTKQELAIAGIDPIEDSGSQPTAESSEMPTETYSDSLVAKWFATKWMPLEFAINFVLQLGLRSLGPRSLQALALREPDAKGVADRLKNLEERGISISHQVYSDALVFFANDGKDDLLSTLLSSDVHPNEFDDPLTRKMLATNSIREGDQKQAELLRAVEETIQRTKRPAFRKVPLDCEPDQEESEDISEVIQRKAAPGNSMHQQSIKHILQHYFNDVGWHAKQGGEDSLRLNIIINAMRNAARQRIAIPTWCWRKVLFILGRTGRLDELEQLCLEIVNMYKSQHDCLIPVHPRDVPEIPHLPLEGGAQLLALDILDASSGCSDITNGQTPRPTKRRNRPNQTQDPSSSTTEHIMDTILPVLGAPGEMYENAETIYIPGDLDFAHPEHPLSRIFDPYLQRSIIRWGFDQTMAQRPRSLDHDGEFTHSPVNFDTARGIHLLSLLRDHGVVVQRGMVRAAVLSRIALSQVPGRRRNPARDSHEISTESFKDLVDSAWGSDLLPKMSELVREIERKKVHTWGRYPQLYLKAFDDEEPSDEIDNQPKPSDEWF
jgi:hypothetical protein